MSLLNRLLKEPPSQHYGLTKRLVFEIDEARKMGYSWKQIKWAAEGMLRECGEWREGLSLRENREIDEVLRSGGRKEIKALFGRIEKAYRQAKAPPPPATPPTPPPPPVEKGSGTQSKEEPGVVDATEFAKMSPDEQADFLIRNKFV